MRRPPTMADATAARAAGLAALARPGRRLILGTASPARRAVLADLAREHGFEFAVLTADLDEKNLGLAARASGDALGLVTALAAAKGDALADRLDADAASSSSMPALLITADQVVCRDERVDGAGPGDSIREKPADDAQAAAWLVEYRTHPPSTLSALALTTWPDRRRVAGVHAATVVFVEGGVPDGEVAAVAASAMGCAGGLRVEGPAAPFVQRLEGGRDSVFGLPVDLLLSLAAELG